jgi:membrane-associated protease RseP (regulator of RpoE activity)
MITALILFFAVVILGWGFYRARPLGQLGLLAWLQSAVLMAPWLMFFGLFAVGVYLNLAGVLFLLLGSIGLYIFLGRQLRALAAEKKGTDPLPHPGPEVSEASHSVVPATDTSLQPNQLTSANLPTSTLPTMPAEDVQAVKGIFGIDTFFATETIPYQNGVIFKGNLRGEPDYSHQQLTNNLTQQLGDRYRLFLVEGVEEKPVVVVLPSANDPKSSTVAQKILALVLALMTVATSLEVAGLMQGFDFSGAPERIAEVLPMGTGILAILGIHELGHRLLARRHQIRLSPPFLIPTWQIGSFGALMRFESLLPNRSVLFDIAFAGPAAGGLLSLGLLLLGLLLSNPSSFFQVPVEFFQGSILVGTLGRVVLGEAIQTALVAVHPLVILGWLGLVITAINLMPAGQLDGGRIVQAIYGRKTAGRTTVATLVVLGLASLVNPLSLYWAIIILFLQRDLERPALNELTEPDDTRAALGLLILFLMAATLLPLTPSLAGRLGIGSL